MSCLIEINGNIALEGSIGLFEDLLYEFQNSAIVLSLENNVVINKFIAKLDELVFTQGSTTLDIGKIIKNQKDLLLFIKILESTISKIEPNLKLHAKNALYNFKKKIKSDINV